MKQVWGLICQYTLFICGLISVIGVGAPAFAQSLTGSEMGVEAVNDAQTTEIGGTTATGPQLHGEKEIAMLRDGSFSVPGNEVVYTIRIANTGPQDVDEDTVFLVDELPAEVSFINASFSDEVGKASQDAVFFEQTANAGLDFDFDGDIGFSASPSRPSSFSECSTEPDQGLNPAIRYICFNPKGVMPAGNPNPAITFKFRARIK
ncbi:MAG: hypothetical protein ABJG15_08525 [Hyphomonadaceae bacterium]